MSEIKLNKYGDVREEPGWPGPVDIVLYKDDKGKLYRLKFVDDGQITDVVQVLHRVMCVGKHAPETIEGKIIFENADEIRILSKENKIYGIQKNAEKHQEVKK